MMKYFYRLAMFLVSLLLPLLAIFDGKLNRFVSGRKHLFERLNTFRRKSKGKLYWFHVASLGEYEQAKPLISICKEKYPESFVTVSFFSPSGYEPTIKKPQKDVDFITYLPLDRKRWAEKFIQLLNPDVVFFVKYDLWFEHISALKARGIPIYLVCALFRADQQYFASDGFFRKILFQMDHIFTQNQESVHLLQSIGYNMATKVGDTRFERVWENAQSPKSFPQIASWLGERETVVLGSVWEEDMEILYPIINSNPEYRWIIAPHDLNGETMRKWAKRIHLQSDFYTSGGLNNAPKVLFLDTIGMLSSVYQFAKIAYVGGAFGSGLHNILEPIGFGVPVIFGKVKYASKFPEAKLSINNGCGFQVENIKELTFVFDELENGIKYKEASMAAENWVKDNLGASSKIFSKIEQIRNEL